MSNSVTGPSRERQSTLFRVAVALRRSFFLSLATFGVLLLAIGFAFDSVLPLLGYDAFAGVVAGMFGIWGATAIVVGIVTYGTLRYFREY